jgi:hypothetical protein
VREQVPSPKSQVPSPGERKMTKIKDFQEEYKEDQHHKKKWYRTYLPRFVCWAETIQDKETALRYLTLQLNMQTDIPPPVYRRLLEFGMRQNKVTSPSGREKEKHYSLRDLQKQLLTGRRLFTTINIFVDKHPGEAALSEIEELDNRFYYVIHDWHHGKTRVRNVHLCLAENCDLVLWLLDIGGFQGKEKIKILRPLLDAFCGLGYGFGPVAVANFVLTQYIQDKS